MEQHYYRFRSIDALLGEHAELEKQEIYFASPSELNDPMEGFKDLFWQGDEMVWRSLLKNYLFCLLKSLTLVMLQGETFEKANCADFVRQTDDDLPDAPIRQIYAGICETFFAHPVVGDLITMLASAEHLGLTMTAAKAAPHLFTIA